MSVGRGRADRFVSQAITLRLSVCADGILSPFSGPCQMHRQQVQALVAVPITTDVELRKSSHVSSHWIDQHLMTLTDTPKCFPHRLPHATKGHLRAHICCIEPISVSSHPPFSAGLFNFIRMFSPILRPLHLGQAESTGWICRYDVDTRTTRLSRRDTDLDGSHFRPLQFPIRCTSNTTFGMHCFQFDVSNIKFSKSLCIFALIIQASLCADKFTGLAPIC
jgi:hypothetical protein